MKITILEKIHWGNTNKEKVKETEIDCKGLGTKKDPIIIDSSLNLPQKFEIYELNLNVVMKDCTFEYFSLNFSQNFIIQNCEFKFLKLYNSINIKITNIEAGDISLRLCKNCSVEDSILEGFKLDHSHNNFVKNCIVKHFFNPRKRSKGNILESNKFSEEDFEELKEVDSPRVSDKGTFLLYGNWETERVFYENPGTKDDPIIIDKVDINTNNYSYFTLNDNRFYVDIKNFNPKKAYFFNDKNISLEKCKFSRYCYLKDCSNFELKNISTKLLRIGKCNNIKIENSIIDRISTFDGFNGGLIFNNCLINRLKQNIVDTCTFENSNFHTVFSNKSIKYYYIEHKLEINLLFLLFIWISISLASIFLFGDIGLLFGVISLGLFIIIYYLGMAILIIHGQIQATKAKKKNKK